MSNVRMAIPLSSVMRALSFSGTAAVGPIFKKKLASNGRGERPSCDNQSVPDSVISRQGWRLELDIKR